jgi:hypothetical protein
MDDKLDSLDGVIDAALQTHSQADPPVGIEERILTRAVRTNGSAAKSPQRQLAFAGLILAVCVCLFALTRFGTTGASRTEQHSVVLSAHALNAWIVAPPQVLPQPRRRPGLRLTAKQKRFPMPQPLTAGKSALLRFVSRDPEEAAEDFASLQTEASSPINIQPIEIQPLQSDNASN